VSRPDAARPTELGGDVGLGKAAEHHNYNSVPAVHQASGLIGVPNFDALLRKSTPSELLVRVDLHRRYLPDNPLPVALQRAIGLAWCKR
jgi:hypothetical protein